MDNRNYQAHYNYHIAIGTTLFVSTFTYLSHTHMSSPFETVTASHKASQLFPTFGEPARTWSSLDNRFSMISSSGFSGMVIKV